MRETKENEQTLYSVSEAVQETGVPSHVLRYWEDELGLAIRRTKQGHRVYSEEDLATFRKVKDLKEKGIQLKAIRLLFEDTQEGRQFAQLFGKDEGAMQRESFVRQGVYGLQSESPAGGLPYGQNEDPAAEISNPDTLADNTDAETAGDVEYEVVPKSETGTYRLFEAMLRSLISEAVAGQNEKLEAELADLFRNEIEELYIQLRQDMGEREAAAAHTSGRAMPERGHENLLRRVIKIFSH